MGIIIEAERLEREYRELMDRKTVTKQEKEQHDFELSDWVRRSSLGSVRHTLPDYWEKIRNLLDKKQELKNSP